MEPASKQQGLTERSETSREAKTRKPPQLFSKGRGGGGVSIERLNRMTIVGSDQIHPDVRCLKETLAQPEERKLEPSNMDP